MNKIITRIKGGLGNQLFCYAAARRLALFNQVELVIDDVSGFVRDTLYQRQYLLDKFQIPVRKATSSERLEPFERYRRGVQKWLARNKPFVERQYLEQEGVDFDPRLLDFRVKGTVYLDGLWQSEAYFKDVEATIRNDLCMTPPTDPQNRDMAEHIQQSNAVAVHVRWFNAPGSDNTHNTSLDYYQHAITLMDEQVPAAHYFLFSDDPVAASRNISLPAQRMTCVSHNKGDENAYADLWLMTQCQHFITANSTFSWWGAWLSPYLNKKVITPDPALLDNTNFWRARGMVPDEWLRL